MTGLTIEQLADRIGVGRLHVAAILADEQARGHASVAEDVWTLTVEAESAFGRFLRQVTRDSEPA